MQRRELLESMINTALALGLLGHGAGLQAHPHICETDAAESTEALQWQLQRWARRDTSEQSAPMFLGLENLAASDPLQSYVPDQLNQQLAAKFERYADLLLQFKPEADENDVAALVVLLAEQELVPEAARLCT